MDYLIDQARFLSALSLAQTIADRRSTMPALNNVLLSAENEEYISCQATDMMIASTERVPAKVQSHGKVCVGVRHLLNVVRALPAGQIHVVLLDNNRVQITTGRSEFQLVGLAYQDFPELPTLKNTKVDKVRSSEFRNLFDKVLFSVSSDESRVNLNGALLVPDKQKVTMVSTDGHRLTLNSANLEFQHSSKRQIIVPRKGMVELKRALDRMGDECELAITDQHMFVRDDDLAISIKLTSATFPPYSQVIPQTFERVVILSRTTLLGALRCAEVVAPEKTATIRVHLEEHQLQLVADNPDLGNSDQTIEVDYSGTPLTVGFNARYLIEALEAIDTPEVRLEFQGELDPCVIRPNSDQDFLAVVMPMRI